LTGLTEISEIVSTAVNEKGETVPCHGKLYYRGYDIEDIVKGALLKKDIPVMRKLYISSCLVNFRQQKSWKILRQLLARYRTLPTSFRQGYYYESTQQGYDEYPCPQRSDTLLI
jgi:citrate synthase